MWLGEDIPVSAHRGPGQGKRGATKRATGCRHAIEGRFLDAVPLVPDDLIDAGAGVVVASDDGVGVNRKHIGCQIFPFDMVNLDPLEIRYGCLLYTSPSPRDA